MIVGVLAAGQLGRMMALEGYPLGLRFRFLEPKNDAPASWLAETIEAPYTDPAALQRFSDGLCVATYEFENVPVESAEWIAERVPFYPPPAALGAAQDRLEEKWLFQRLSIPAPSFKAVDSLSDLQAAIEEIGLPGVVKTRRLGYDGKGQSVIRERAQVESVWESLGNSALIYEQFVPFDRELSIIAVRSRHGEIACYPLVQNEHREGILRVSTAPAPDVSPELRAEAEEYARRILEAFEYAGVLTIEFFQRDGALFANEIAPRVHNSGHWTLDGAVVSQFENHLRAIMGLPLGRADAIGHSIMLNLIGAIPPREAVLAVPGAHLHLYDKEPRPRRKVGHITLCGDDPAELRVRAGAVAEFIKGAVCPS
ncbi:MAG: 5-(carboxyamino)imidazole ribonucleotide synthase [bacterium]|nr:5-(carboxyamino)imidazole ribonucleotide synthase [bacterium]